MFGKGLLLICNRYSIGLRFFSLKLELLDILSIILSAIDKKLLLKEFEIILKLSVIYCQYLKCSRWYEYGHQTAQSRHVGWYTHLYVFSI